MATDGPTYPILVDTDALIAVANSPLWELISEHIGLTTTNVCQQELQRHRDETRSSAPEGSRPYRLHHGSVRVLEAIEDDETPLTRAVSVPRPHGADAGEQSLKQQLVQHPDSVDYVVLMDAHGRRSIRRGIKEGTLMARVVPPTFLFYILYDNDLISREEFCEACAELLASEGWIGYQAVEAAWGGIPVDCSDVIGAEFLPPS
jgi:hypothetical protein